MGKRNCFFNPNFQRIANQLHNNNKVVVGKDRQEKKVSSNRMCSDCSNPEKLFEAIVMKFEDVIRDVKFHWEKKQNRLIFQHT